MLLLRAKTAAERQQKQRGEEKRSPRNANTGMPAIASRKISSRRRQSPSRQSAAGQPAVGVPYAPLPVLAYQPGHRAAVEDSLCRLRHLRRLVRLHKLLHVLRVFIVFPGHDDVHVGRVFIFDKDAVTNRRQPGLLQVGGADDSHVDFGIVEYARQLRPSSSMIFRLRGLSVISTAVGSRPVPALRVISFSLQQQ